MSLNASLNYSTLKIPEEVAYTVKHDKTYIVSRDPENENKICRRIYYNQPLEPEEEQLKQALIEDLKKSNINYDVVIKNPVELLRFAKFHTNLNDSIANIVQYVQYVTDKNKMKLTAAGKNALQNGIIYLGGRDKQYRPTLIINAYKIDLSDQQGVQGFQNALVYMIKQIEDHLFYPGYVENLNVIIETNQIEVKSFPISVVKEAINLVTKLFPARNNLIFVMNISETMKKNWKMIEGQLLIKFISISLLGCLQMDQKKSFLFISSSNLQDLKLYYHSAELEQKYGGTAPNIENFYPPVAFVNQSYYQNLNNTSIGSQHPSHLINKSFEPVIENLNNKSYKFQNLTIPNNTNEQPKQIFSTYENYEFQHLKTETDQIQDPLMQAYSKSDVPRITQNQQETQQAATTEGQNANNNNQQPINENLEGREQNGTQNASNRGIFCGLCYRSKNKQNQEVQYLKSPTNKQEKQKNVGVCLIF